MPDSDTDSEVLALRAQMVGHEVRQPLAAMLLHAEAAARGLAKSPPDIASAKRAIERVIGDGHRAAKIAESVQSLLQNENQDLAEIDINDAIRTVTNDLTSSIDHHNIVLGTSLNTSLPKITADRVQLDRLINNLMRNAIEAMLPVYDRTRTLTIETGFQDRDRILVVIIDSGVGIDAGSLELIFIPRFTTKRSGSGLGLAICKRIVTNHGGSLWAAPNHPNGSILQFTLPISNLGGSSHQSAHDGLSHANLGNAY